MNGNFNNNNEFNNLEQDNYYNNGSYYSNNNYDNNYSDTTYEEKEKKSGIWWKVLLVILVLLIIILLLLKFCGGSGKKSDDELYAELTAKICTAADTYIMNNPSVLDRAEPGKTAIVKFQILANENLINSQIENPYYDGGLFKKGTQPKYYSMDNSVRLTVLNDGTLNCELVDNSKDVTAPVLRLNGDAEITLAVGTEFEDPGFVATDDYDGDITDKVVRSGNVTSSKAGTYEITYTVQDSAGNVTTVKRKIIFEEYADIDITLGSILDSVTPQISLKGANPYCMVKGTKYVEPGAIATDNVDGNITDRISVTGNVTGNLMGSFRLVYKVEDSSGNQAVAYRAVIVTTSCPEQDNVENVANNNPTITLIGKNAVTINRGTEYIDLGATAYDKEDGDITGKIVTDTTGVNANSAGIYKVIYRVTDSAGVTVSASRTVTVKEAVMGNPVVRFTEDKKNVVVSVGEGSNSLINPPKAVNENGVALSVSKYIEDYTTKQRVNAIDWNKAGKYRVIYTATHGNGVLKQTKSIVVTVTEADVTITGKDAINVILRTNNCNITESDLIKAGVTFETVGNKTPIISLTGNLENACKIGTYEVKIEAKVDGGETTSKNITVYVVGGTPEPAPVGLPGQVRITGNTANPTNVYNTNNVWVGGAVTGISLTFESTPVKGTDIAYFEWIYDCNSDFVREGGKISKLTSTMGTMSWTEAGNNSICIRAVTTDNVAGPWSSPVKLLIDRTGPDVEFTHTWADEKEDWHNSGSLVLEYKSTDSESGLSHFEYTYDDVKGKKSNEIITYNEATGKLTVYENTEPARTELFVYVRAVDKVGNKGEWTVNPAFANMDTVKPNIPVLEVVDNNTPNVKIKTTFTDSKSVRPSGFGKLLYTIDDGKEKSESSKTITMPANTTTQNITNNVKVWAVDKAGNKSDNFASTSVIVTPGVAVTGVKLTNNGKEIVSGASCSSSTINPSKTFTLSATPIPSNTTQKEVVWKVDNANVAVIDENGKVTAKNVGTTNITAKIGDVTTTCVLTVKKQETVSTDSTTIQNSCPDDYPYKSNAEVNNAVDAAGCDYPVYSWKKVNGEKCQKYECKKTLEDAVKAIKGAYISKEAAANAAKNECGVGKYKVVEQKGYKYSVWKYECLSEDKCMAGYLYIDGKCVVSYPTSSCAGNCDSRTQVCVPAAGGVGKYYCESNTDSSATTCRGTAFPYSTEAEAKEAADKNCDNLSNIISSTSNGLTCYDYYCNNKKCDESKWEYPNKNACEFYAGPKGIKYYCVQRENGCYVVTMTGCRYKDKLTCDGWVQTYRDPDATCVKDERGCYMPDEKYAASICWKSGEFTKEKCEEKGIETYGKRFSGCAMNTDGCFQIYHFLCNQAGEYDNKESCEADARENEYKACFENNKGCYMIETERNNNTSTCQFNDQASCVKAAPAACPYGHSGCKVDKYGCYTYTCKPAPSGGGSSSTSTTTKPSSCAYYNAAACRNAAESSCGKGKYVGCYNSNTNGCYSFTCTNNKPVGCFLVGTQVLTIDGYKDIDKIKVNDKVLSYNEETKKNEYKKVTKVFIHNDMNDVLYTINVANKVVEASSKHRFYVKTNKGYEWIAAEELKVGYMLMDKDGKYNKITNINKKNIFADLYNLEVEDNHNYYVTKNNILVHNDKELAS